MMRGGRNQDPYQYHHFAHRNLPSQQGPLLQDPTTTSETEDDEWNHDIKDADEMPAEMPISQLHALPEPSQEYREYLNKYNERVSDCKRKGNVRIRDEIDPIEPGLAAKLNIKRLASAARQSPIWGAVKKAMLLLLDENGIPPEALNSEKKVQEEKDRRNLNRPPTPVTPLVGSAMRVLQTDSYLYYGKSKYSDLLTGKDGPISYASAFFIRKSTGKLRVISDGRWANVHFNPRYGSFSFFSLETLRSVISNLSGRKKWFAINLDLRHWFHQIPLPRRYWPYLGIPIPERPPGVGLFWLFPRALPMGWILAPYLAQACTWSLLLTRPVTFDKDGKSYSKGFPKESCLPDESHFKGRNELFTWIPLKGGGGLFVFLDNILVVTPDEGCANWWFEKIVEDCEEYHAVMKGVNVDDDIDTKKRKLRETCFFTMTENDTTTTFDYLGITWSHSGCYLKVSEEDKQRVIKTEADGGWKGKRREMASILGKIMWYRRVHGITYFDQQHSPQTSAILEIYRTLTPSESDKASWNETTTFRKELIDELQMAWNLRTNETFRPAEIFSSQIPMTSANIAYAITDAATKTHCAAYHVYHLGEYSKNPSIADLKSGSTTYEGGIAFGELLAIKLAIKRLLEDDNKNQIRLVLLATDNMSCKHWLEKGHAHQVEILKLLSEIHDLLKQHNTRLYTGYVISEENVADDLSREVTTINATKLLKNHALLKKMETEARGVWMISGERTGGRESDTMRNAP